MKQPHYSALMQTKNLENSLILYLRDSDNTVRYNQRDPLMITKIMTTIFPKLGHLQHLITMLSYECHSGVCDELAFEIDKVMGDIKLIIKELRVTLDFGFEMDLIQDQFEEMKERIRDIIAEYFFEDYFKD